MPQILISRRRFLIATGATGGATTNGSTTQLRTTNSSTSNEYTITAV